MQPGVDRNYTWHVDRGKFDLLLLQHAHKLGADVFEGVRVLGVDFAGDAPVVRYQLGRRETGTRVQLVVDASGRHTLLGNQLKLKVKDPVFDQYALHAWFDGYDRAAAARGDQLRDDRAREVGEAPPAREDVRARRRDPAIDAGHHLAAALGHAGAPELRHVEHGVEPLAIQPGDEVVEHVEVVAVERERAPAAAAVGEFGEHRCGNLPPAIHSISGARHAPASPETRSRAGANSSAARASTPSTPSCRRRSRRT